MGLGGRQVRLRQSGRAQAAYRQGAILRPFPQAVLEACYNAAQEVYAEHMKTNVMFKTLHDSLIPYRNDWFGWEQVAELSFDTFMMRMRTRT